MSSHPYVLPGEGQSVGFGPAESRVKYVSFFNLFVFYYVFVLFRCCLIFCSHPIFAFFFVSNEWPSRVASLLRLPPVAEMSPQERQAVDLYVDDVRDLFAE